MKRERGEGEGGKKKVRFAEQESEIIPEPDIELPDATQPPRNPETAWLEDVRQGEVPFEPELESDPGEVPLEPFNLEEERKTGRFDDDEFYVEAKVDPSETDAWLMSSESTVCSIDVLRKHAAQQEAMAAAETMPKPTLAHTMELKQRIVELLEPRETVLAALRRFAKQKSPEDPKKIDLTAFEELTELADGLLNSGEMDAYSLYKEEFEHSLQTMGYGKSTSTDDPPNDSRPQPASTRSAEVAFPDDIFAEESDQEDSKPVQESSDFASWSISELKRYLTERHVDCSTVVEKQELVEKARTLPTAQPVPEGFAFHAESGYYYHAERGLYYDGATGCFYDPRTTQWFDKNWKPM